MCPSLARVGALNHQAPSWLLLAAVRVEIEQSLSQTVRDRDRVTTTAACLRGGTLRRAYALHFYASTNERDQGGRL